MKRLAFSVSRVTLLLLVLSVTLVPVLQVAAAPGDDNGSCAFSNMEVSSPGAQIQSNCQVQGQGSCPPGQLRVCCIGRLCWGGQYICCDPPWLFPLSCGLCCREWIITYECHCYPEHAIPTSIPHMPF